MEVVLNENKFKFKTHRQQIIIIPKRIVKKTNKRNKIRRQIRAIMRDNNINKYFVKYAEQNVLNFNEIKQIINDFIAKDNNASCCI